MKRKVLLVYAEHRRSVANDCDGDDRNSQLATDIGGVIKRRC
jgi:hypothetical protein